jgi:NAD(P)H dehydrogenase (quinone)
LRIWIGQQASPAARLKGALTMPPPPVTQLVVLAHPDADSFCGAVARRWSDRARGHGQLCDLRDLYADGFDPVLRSTEQPGKPGYAADAGISAECSALQKLGVLVFVYPIWFGSPPAMLKGYIERVIGSGLVIGEAEHAFKPLANVRQVHISTSASSEPWLAEKGVPIALGTIFERYMAQIFGAKESYHLHLDCITAGMSKMQADFQFAKVDQVADLVCAEANTDRWGHVRAAGIQPSSVTTG